MLRPGSAGIEAREASMVSREEMDGKWQQVKGSIKERWGELTDDDWKRADGKLDQLAGIIQEKYGAAKEDVQRELDRMFRRGDSSSA
jgi:uncharacterized protein YjbJ (UPF0337 family)